MSVLKSINLRYTLLLVLFSKFLSAQNKPDPDVSEFDLPQSHIVTYQHTFSKYYNHWSVHYREFKRNSNKFQIPVTLSFGKTNMNEDLLENKNIKNIDTYSFGMGFDGYEYLGNGVYFNLGVEVSPGWETVERITEGKSTTFLIGGNINTGLLYVPFPYFGLVIGGKIIGELSNSRVLNISFGFAIEAGINF